jgi:hypothetical protein
MVLNLRTTCIGSNSTVLCGTRIAAWRCVSVIVTHVFTSTMMSETAVETAVVSTPATRFVSDALLPLLLLVPHRMFPEFEETVTLELDFVQEGTNCERVAR